MMPDEFLQLVQRGECDTIDFKRVFHDLTSKSGKLDLIKDVTCLANTPRETSAYILYGVSVDAGGRPTVVGLPSQIDDVRLIDTISSGQVFPVPEISYHPLSHEQKLVGALEIPPRRNGPVLPTKVLPDGFEPGRIWLRRSSKNVPANASELARCMKWFNGGTWQPEDRFSDGWNAFLESVDSFSDQRSLILVADPVEGASLALAAGLGFAPWKAVLDFDHQSAQSGLLSSTRMPLESHRSLLRVAKGDTITIHKRGSTLWFFREAFSAHPTHSQ